MYPSNTTFNIHKLINKIKWHLFYSMCMVYVVCILHTCIHVYFLCPCVNSLFWDEIVKFSLIWYSKVLHSWWLCFCSLAYYLTQKTASYLHTYLRYAGSLVICDGIWLYQMSCEFSILVPWQGKRWHNVIICKRFTFQW